jgi:flagellar basal-body rod modification protein FlgD
MSSFDTTMQNLGIKTYGAGQVSNSQGYTTDTSKLGKTNMDQNDFLKLMTAQLKNQDPFAPVDNTQMVAQMAQFSSLAGISEMNTTLKAISDRLTGGSTGDAMAWIGRTVLTEGNVAWPTTDGALSGQIELADEASDVTVTIQNAQGATLKTVSLGHQSKGSLDFAWDGTTDSGDPAGAGPFTIKVDALSAKGTKVGATPLVWAPVTSVALDSNGEPVLTLPGIGQVSASAVRKIG